MRLRALSVLLFVSFAAASTAAAQIRAIVDGPEPWGMEFIPTGEPHTFMLAFLANGEIFDVEPTALIQFDVAGGKATKWAAKPVEGLTDEPWIWARRP